MKCICEALGRWVRYFSPNSSYGLQRVAIEHVVVEPERFFVETLPRVVVHPIGCVRRLRFRPCHRDRGNVRKLAVSFTGSLSSHATSRKSNSSNRDNYKR